MNRFDLIEVTSWTGLTVLYQSMILFYSGQWVYIWNFNRNTLFILQFWSRWQRLEKKFSKHCWFDFWFLVFNATFSYIMATNFSGGRSWSTQKEPLTMVKQLVTLLWLRVQCTLFCNLQSRCEPTLYWW
jgi:hypothetical protein